MFLYIPLYRHIVSPKRRWTVFKLDLLLLYGTSRKQRSRPRPLPSSTNCQPTNGTLFSQINSCSTGWKCDRGIFPAQRGFPPGRRSNGKKPLWDKFHLITCHNSGWLKALCEGDLLLFTSLRRNNVLFCRYSFIGSCCFKLLYCYSQLIYLHS